MYDDYFRVGMLGDSMANIQAISVSDKKGVRKTNVDKANFVHNHGIEGDAHAGEWHKQISLLAVESVNTMVAKGLDVKSGDFAENVTTEGLDLLSLPIGSVLEIGGIKLIISQLGKVCHNRCAIYHQAGDCVMPREGIFGVVRGNAELSVGDEIKIHPKVGLSIGIITLSDRAARGERADGTGPALQEYIHENLETSFIRNDVIADEPALLERYLKDFADTQKFDLIITNGSTGVSPRDIAPDATLPLIERRLPGFEEAMRMESYKITKNAIVSRAVCGIRGSSLIINLPGSPKAAVENLGFVMPAIKHTIDKMNGDPSDCA